MRLPALALVGAALLAGCATGPVARTNTCINASRQVLDFQVESAHSVIVRQSSHHHYRIHLVGSCPALARADYVSFSTGLPRLVGHGLRGGPVWAETGVGQSCVRRGDYLVMPDPWSLDVGVMPAPRCRIERIDRLPSP